MFFNVIQTGLKACAMRYRMNAHTGMTISLNSNSLWAVIGYKRALTTPAENAHVSDRLPVFGSGELGFAPEWREDGLHRLDRFTVLWANEEQFASIAPVAFLS